MLVVSRDYEGLRLATRELFEVALEERAAGRFRSVSQTAKNADKIAREADHVFALSPAYYDRVGYLLELSETMELVRFGPDDVTADEVRGVRVVREERQRFTAEHPPCPSCGEPSRKFAQACWACGTKFETRRQHGGTR